jgi:hypothetical protein
MKDRSSAARLNRFDLEYSECCPVCKTKFIDIKNLLKYYFLGAIMNPCGSDTIRRTAIRPDRGHQCGLTAVSAACIKPAAIEAHYWKGLPAQPIMWEQGEA